MHYQVAFNTSSIGMAVVSPDGRWMQVNPALCKLLGYDEGELLANDFQSITHPDDLASDLEHLRAMVGNEIDTYHTEKRYFHKSGAIIDVLLSVSCARSENGDLLYCIAQIQDITTRKGTEKVLKFALGEAGTDLWDWDMRTNLLVIPDRLKEIFGLTQEGPIPLSDWHGRVHPEDLKSAISRRNIILNGELSQFQIECRARDRDKNYRWFLLRGLVVGRDRNGAPIRAMGTIVDTSPIHAGEAKRSNLMKQYIDLVAAARDSIISIDRDGLIRMANPATFTVFGYDPDEILREPLDILLPPSIHSAHRNWVQTFFDDPASSPAMARLRTAQGRHKDGTTLFLQISLTKSNATGQELATAVIRDISEINRLQEQLHQADKMAALGQLAGGIAHDVNNGLSIIMSSAELIEAEAEPGSLSERMCDRIITTVERNATMIRRMLAFSRRASIDPRNLELTGVLREFSEAVRPTLGTRIQVTTHSATDRALWAHLDRGMLESCLLNLSINARDAMPNGGTLTFSLGADDTVAGGGPWIVLAVADSGIGMSEDVRRRIFEPFFTTKPAASGTGLGLAMVYGFVRQSGGRVDVRSSPGRGTKFTLRFPRLKQPGETAPPDALRSTSQRPRYNHLVLLVEDNDLLRESLTAQLESFGCRVLSARTAAEAQQYVDSSPGISLILSDYDLGPGPTGVEFARWILKKGQQIPGIIMSGHLGTEAAVNDVKATGWRYIPKPVNRATLSKLLGEASALTVPK